MARKMYRDAAAAGKHLEAAGFRVKNKPGNEPTVKLAMEGGYKVKVIPPGAGTPWRARVVSPENEDVFPRESSFDPDRHIDEAEFDAHPLGARHAGEVPDRVKEFTGNPHVMRHVMQWEKMRRAVPEGPHGRTVSPLRTAFSEADEEGSRRALSMDESRDRAREIFHDRRHIYGE